MWGGEGWGGQAARLLPHELEHGIALMVDPVVEVAAPGDRGRSREIEGDRRRHGEVERGAPDGVELGGDVERREAEAQVAVDLLHAEGAWRWCVCGGEGRWRAWAANRGSGALPRVAGTACLSFGGGKQRAAPACTWRLRCSSFS